MDKINAFLQKIAIKIFGAKWKYSKHNIFFIPLFANIGSIVRIILQDQQFKKQKQ